MLNRDTARREAARTDGQPASGRGWRRVELLVFSIYAAWCAIAVAEIVGRHMTGASPFPGILANYNGNIAVSGFIAPFGLLTQALAASRWLPPRVARGLGLAIIAVASLAWTVFFVVMEMTDLYGPNTQAVGDIPASLFGAACGTYAAVRLAREPAGRASKRAALLRRRSRVGTAH